MCFSLSNAQNNDPFVDIDKIAIENPNNCNQFDITTTITGTPPSKPVEVVLVLDRSGSMGFVDSNGDIALDFAKDAALDFIDNLFLPINNPTGLNKVGIVSYSATATTDTNLLLDTAANRTTLTLAVNSLVASGTTNVQDGMIKADQLMTSQGTFDCDTSRSIIMLSDGVPTRSFNPDGSGDGCQDDVDLNQPNSGGNDTDCITRAIAAGIDAQTTVIAGEIFEQTVFSVGLLNFYQNDPVRLNNATFTLNGMDNTDGADITFDAADLDGIYLNILGQLSAVAKQLSNDFLVSDNIGIGWQIVPGSVIVSKGLPLVNGQSISWDLDEIGNETVTMNYSIIPTSTDVCGLGIFGNSVMNYENASCDIAQLTFVNPQVCVPCPVLDSDFTRQGCTNFFDYTGTLTDGPDCSPVATDFTWIFTLNGVQIGTASQLSGTFEYTGTEDLVGNIAATLSYNGTYGNNCTLPMMESTNQIILAPLLEVTLDNFSDALCNGEESGSINISVTGGVPPYTFLWSNGETTEDLPNVGAGTYNVTVTDSNTCAADVSTDIVIGEPTPAITITNTVLTEVDCYSTSTGAIDIDVIGGTAPYTYTWSDGVNEIATSQDIEDLAAGDYTITIIDANLCVLEETYNISEPNTALSTNATVASEISCFGLTDGAITISFAGGTSPYDISGDFTATDVTTDQSHTGLAAGTYNYTITDANGCTETASATIAAAPSDVTANATVASEISCFGLTDGAITISFAGGTSPYDISGDFTAT
ncbi:hypothetical protein BTO05_03345, partial [Winogradskyella sp. PC-19]